MLGSEKNITLVRILLYRLLLNRGSTVNEIILSIKSGQIGVLHI